MCPQRKEILHQWLKDNKRTAGFVAKECRIGRQLVYAMLDGTRTFTDDKARIIQERLGVRFVDNVSTDVVDKRKNANVKTQTLQAVAAALSGVPLDGVVIDSLNREFSGYLFTVTDDGTVTVKHRNHREGKPGPNTGKKHIGNNPFVWELKDIFMTQKECLDTLRERHGKAPAPKEIGDRNHDPNDAACYFLNPDQCEQIDHYKAMGTLPENTGYVPPYKRKGKAYKKL